MRITTAIACAVMLSATARPHLFLTADSAHTLFQPNPGGGSAGRTVQLPRGGMGVTTGGTPYYQTYAAPGGSGVAIPNGNFSTTIGSGGHVGTAPTPD